MPGNQPSQLSPADAAALAEDVDLPAPLRRQILELHARLDGLDHWQVLGLPWNAPITAARDAYLEKVKLFHPDRYAGKRLGSYKPRIERIFRACTEARDVLADPIRREPYARKTAPPEEFARAEARKLLDEERATERRARLARTNPLVGHAAKVQELFLRGKKALEEGRAAQAANDFLTVLGLDPRHAEARALVDQARRQAGVERAKELYEQAVAAEATGRRADALDLCRRAVEAHPANPRYAASASRLAREAGDVEGARALAEQAVRAGPRDARAHEALGAALHAAGEGRQARHALEKALELDPNLDSAKALLKKLRWSFLG